MKKSIKDKKVEAEVLCSKWVADGNEAMEKGDWNKAQRCYEKSDFWLDRVNKLDENS